MEQYIRYTIGLTYKELFVGMKIIGNPVTVTDSHIMLFAGLSGDFNPLHVDIEFAKRTLFRTRIAHGLLVMSMMSGSLGMSFAGTAIALTDFKARFIKPVKPGDTIRPIAEVTKLMDEPKYNGGKVTLKITVTNQENDIVAEGETTLLVTK
jgi:acyl dehydratase